MEPYLALASLKSYAFDALVWLCIGIPLLFVIYVLLRRKPILILIFGALVVLGALPIASMSELSINGCCGAPSTGHEGLGYVIGGVVAIIGILIMVFRNKLAKK
jgi:hypothetical protein